MSPAKNPETEIDKELTCRQEGRAGKIKFPMADIKQMGDYLYNIVFPQIKFQQYREWADDTGQILYIFGYCPLFRPIGGQGGHIPTYILRIDRTENEPIVEVFER